MAVRLPKFAVIFTALVLLLLCHLSYISMNLDDCDYTYDYRVLQESGVDRRCNDRICKQYCQAYRYEPQASECDVDDEYVCCCRYCNLKRPKPDGDCEPDACKGECTSLGYELETSGCRGSDLCCCLYDNVPDLDDVNDSDDSSDGSDDGSFEEP